MCVYTHMHTHNGYLNWFHFNYSKEHCSEYLHIYIYIYRIHFQFFWYNLIVKLMAYMLNLLNILVLLRQSYFLIQTCSDILFIF